MNHRSTLTQTILRGIGWLGLGLLSVAVVLSDFIARQPAGAQSSGAILSPPSDAHLFGTDVLGRDVFSETLHALATTGANAALAAVVAILLGGILATIVVRLPKILAQTIRALVGVFAAIPALLLLILIVGVAGHAALPIAAGLAAAPLGFVRAFDQASRNSSHAEYASATGIPATILLKRDLTYEFRTILGSVLARALAAVTILISTASFLGFGAIPPARDLGLMIAAGKLSYLSAWWTVAFPALALVAVVLCARLAAGLDEGERA